MSSEIEGSDNDLVDEPPSASCCSCFKVFDPEVLYRCSTCNSKNENEGQAANQPIHHHCESCITSHLRRKHEVVDCKGYSPAQCDTHEKLCAMYCRECNSVLCHSCIMDHSGHSFQSLDTKSSEVRKKIFEYLNEIEEKSKPLNHLETVSEDSSKKVGDFRSSLSEENLIKTLKSLFNGVIESNLPSWIEIVDEKIKTRESQMSVEGSPPEIVKSFTGSLHKFVRSDVFRKRIREVTDEVDKDTNRLKKMLLLSNGKCITQFNDAKNGVESSIEKCGKELRKHVCLEWVADVDDIIRNSISDALSSFKLSLIQNIGIQIGKPLKETSVETDTKNIGCLNLSSDLSPGSFECLFVSVVDSFIKEGTVTLRVFKQIKRNNKSLSNLLESICIQSTDVSSVLKRDYSTAVALHTKSNLLYFFCLKSYRVIKQRQLETSAVPFGFSRYDDGSFTIDSWNSEDQMLLLREKFPIESKLRPKFTQWDLYTVYIVDSNDNIIIYNVETKVELRISYLNHGLSSIDRIRRDNVQRILLFDYKMKLVAVCSITLSSNQPAFEVLKLKKFDLPVSADIQYCCDNFALNRLFVCSNFSFFHFEYIS